MQFQNNIFINNDSLNRQQSKGPVNSTLINTCVFFSPSKYGKLATLLASAAVLVSHLTTAEGKHTYWYNVCDALREIVNANFSGQCGSISTGTSTQFDLGATV